MDLHDGLGPTLAATRIKLAAFHRTHPAVAAVGKAARQIADAIRQVRRIVKGLQPSILEDLGLLPGLQILTADIRRTTGLDITFREPLTLPDVRPWSLSPPTARSPKFSRTSSATAAPAHATSRSTSPTAIFA